MKPSLWSDDDENEREYDGTKKTIKKSFDMYDDLFGTTVSDEPDHMKASLFSTSSLKTSSGNASVDKLFGDDSDENDDLLFGQHRKPHSKINLLFKEDENRESDENNEYDINVVNRNVNISWNINSRGQNTDNSTYAMSNSKENGTKENHDILMKSNDVKGRSGAINLFADDDTDDASADDDFLRVNLPVVLNDNSYKSLYEKEVAKSTQLELRIEYLLEKVSYLEGQLRIASKSENGGKVKSMKESDRQMRQRNRQKFNTTRQKKDDESKKISKIEDEGSNASDIIPNGGYDAGHSTMENRCEDIGNTNDMKNLKSTPSRNLFDESDSDSETEFYVHTVNEVPPPPSALSVTQAPKLTNYVSNRQKQILAKQKRSRTKVRADFLSKSKSSQSRPEIDEPTEGKFAEAVKDCLTESSASLRRGSTGGLKYDGEEWQSSSEENNGDGESDSGNQCNDVSEGIAPEESNGSSSLKLESNRISEDIYRVIEVEVDALVRSWCSKQRNLITMIQTVPEIYSNESIPTSIYQISYASPPSDVRKAYLRIARLCHPDKQRHNPNSGPSEIRSQLVAEKLFAALADAYNTYKMHFDN